MIGLTNFILESPESDKEKSLGKRLFCRLVDPGLGAETNSKAVPAIDRHDSQRQINQLLLAKVLAYLFVDSIWHVPLADQCEFFGPEQGCALTLTVEWCLTPGVEFIEALLAFTHGASILAMHIDAVSAAIDLRGSHLDQF